jgi:hypothetical protein
MKTTYEWAIETLDADGDIVEVQHYDTALRLPAFAEETDWIVLVRDICDEGGVASRSWAYVTDPGKTSAELPAHFTDSDGNETAEVPARFHAEFAKYKANR